MADECVSHHHAYQLLDVLMYHIEPPIRRKLMREVPVAYNAWCKREVVKIVYAANTNAEVPES